MIAKPIQVTVLSSAGNVLGELSAKPSNALWRARKVARRLFMEEDTREWRASRRGLGLQAP